MKEAIYYAVLGALVLGAFGGLLWSNASKDKTIEARDATIAERDEEIEIMNAEIAGLHDKILADALVHLDEYCKVRDQRDMLARQIDPSAPEYVIAKVVSL